MGCVHTHQGIHAIERWGSLNYIQNVVEKIREYNWKAKKTSWIVSQSPTFSPEHDKIQTQWALNVLLENMLERVWWSICSKIESWSWTICCSMSCSNGRRHAWAKGGKRSHVAFRCCWKGNVLSNYVKASRRNGCW